MTTSSVSSRQSSAAVENDEIDLGRLLGYLIVSIHQDGVDGISSAGMG